MAKTSLYRRLYIGRPHGEARDSDEVELASKKSGWDRESGFPSEDLIVDFCYEDFYRVTGQKLEPGEMHKVNIKVEVLD